MEKVKELLNRYKYVVLMVVAGICLMALPSFEKKEATPGPVGENSEYSIEQMQEELEDILSHMDGVGRAEVLLSAASGSKFVYQEDRKISYKGQAASPEDYTSDAQVVVLEKDDVGQDALQTQEIYPEYIGALVVCDGADSAGVVLRVKEAVCVLTGLGSECVSVAKRRES